MERLSYIRRNNRIYAFHAGQVVASAETMEELAPKVAGMDPGYDDYASSGGRFADPMSTPSQSEHDDPNGPYFDPPCPQCGRREGAFEHGHCAACGYQDPQAGLEAGGLEQPPLEHQGPVEPPMPPEGLMGHGASHIVTPNGLKGTILGRSRDVWGDTVTVRFENGRVAQLHVNADYSFETEQAVKTSGLAGLRERLGAPGDVSAEGLALRSAELKAIRSEAATMARGASLDEAAGLDALRIEADYELAQITAALEHLADAEPFIPQAPFAPQAVEQESIGRGDGSWLDLTAQDMIAEAEATDYNALMDEGPEAFVAELHSPALADQGTTRSLASSFIRTKTAGADVEVRDRYETKWLERVEACRRSELTQRKTQTHKEAAAQQDDYSSLPDDILFG